MSGNLHLRDSISFASLSRSANYRHWHHQDNARQVLE